VGYKSDFYLNNLPSYKNKGLVLALLETNFSLYKVARPFSFKNL
jgi:hypothetical protein